VCGSDQQIRRLYEISSSRATAVVASVKASVATRGGARTLAAERM
jgi:hypothetical protein